MHVVTIFPHPDTHPKVVEAAMFLAQGNIENAMDRLAEFFEIDADRNDHPAVKSLLNSCQDSARAIAFEWYASLK